MRTSHLYLNPPSPNERLSKGYRYADIKALSPCITQNVRLYLAETTRLFTQLWANLQSGEADGGQTVPQMILNIFTKIHEMLHILTIQYGYL